MKTTIVGMGEALWDVLPEGKKLGGAPANFSYHMSQFGYDSVVVSAVGDDKLGNEILDSLAAKQLQHKIEKVPYPTGVVQVMLDDAGDSFTAAFMAAILAGKSVAHAHKLAVDVSAYICTQNGAMPGLPEEMKRRVE